MYLVYADQMQEMDRQTIASFGIPGLVLMENAGRGAVDYIYDRYAPLQNKKVAVIAGRGNNGGDGFVIARYLLDRGVSVTCFLLSSAQKVGGDARVNLNLARTMCQKTGRGTIVEVPDAEALKKHRPAIAHHDLFIDALLGTGLNSDVRGFFKDAVELMNASSRPVFAVDIPSGLNSDTGQPMGTAVKADATATFAFAKAGHVLYPGNRYTGDLRIIDIGIPRFIAEEKKIQLSLVEKDEIAALFPKRGFSSHKGSFGHLAVLAGSSGKTGAAALCANAAARCGTGLVTLAIPRNINAQMEPQVIEPMTFLLEDRGSGILGESNLADVLALIEGKQALAVGPGIGTDVKTAGLIQAVVKSSAVPMVIDADGLNCLAGNPDILLQKKGAAVLTPHPGEMARLCGLSIAEIQAGRIQAAGDFAKQYQVTLVLKGAQTVIAAPDGNCFINPTGNPGMASGGMGDVLTGLIAGFCAQGFAPEDAARAGVFIHGLCADRLAASMGAFGYLATDIVNDIPCAIHQDLL